MESEREKAAAEVVQNQQKDNYVTDDYISPAHRQGKDQMMLRRMKENANDRRRWMMAKPTEASAQTRGQRSESVQVEPPSMSFRQFQCVSTRAQCSCHSQLQHQERNGCETGKEAQVGLETTKLPRPRHEDIGNTRPEHDGLHAKRLRSKCILHMWPTRSNA